MILNDEINSILEELKAEDIISLNVKNKSSVTDTMIIASGRSTTSRFRNVKGKKWWCYGQNKRSTSRELLIHGKAKNN